MDPATIGILAAAAILALDKFGLLERFGLVVHPKSTGDFEGELKLADRKLLRLEAEKAAAVLKADALEKERSLEPVMKLVVLVMEHVEQMTVSQGLVLDKLASFNGTLSHLAAGLAETVESQQTVTEALKLVTGFVISDLPMKEPQ